eukprot:scaffold9322_cov168-Amphora_coffeaeformis.AAC.10
MKREYFVSTDQHDDGDDNRKVLKTDDDESDCFFAAILADGLLRSHVHSFLHWKDIMMLGATKKELQDVWVRKRDDILEPVLECLDSLCRSNVHEYCGKVFAPQSERTCTCTNLEDCWEAENQTLSKFDPRYYPEYDEWETHEKCAVLVDFISTVVTNLRQYLQMDLKHASDPKRTPRAIGTVQGNWSLGDGVRGNALIHLYPRRAVLAFNLAMVCAAAGTMMTGHNYDFEDAVLGLGICETVQDMMPLEDTNFKKFVSRWILPRKNIQKVLGDKLVSRVCLTAPFLNWVRDDGTIALPRKERFHLATAVQAMNEWDSDDDGRY